jgi:hypothetical protein
MKKTIIASLSLLPMFACAANLLTNGSFEDGLVGWQEEPGYLSHPAAVIHYESNASYPTGAFGEPIPVDDAVGSGVFDPSGSRAVYFADDAAAPETLTQMVNVHGGVEYTFGFDAYVPARGFSNPGDATISGTVGGLTFASFSASAGPVRGWVHFQAYGIAGADGQVDFVLSFSAGPGSSKDIVVDDVFFAAVSDMPPVEGDTSTAPVPEPGTWAMLAVGLATLAGMSRRGRAAQWGTPRARRSK